MKKSKPKELILREFLNKKIAIIAQEIMAKGFSIVGVDELKISVKGLNDCITEYNVFDTNAADVREFLKKNGLVMEKTKTKPYKYHIQCA